MKITRVFLSSDLRCSFDGLRALATKEKTNLVKTTVIFINTARTKFKLLVDDKYLIYYSNGSRRIPLEALVHLPQAFGGTDVEMNQAIRKSLEERLRK